MGVSSSTIRKGGPPKPKRPVLKRLYSADLEKSFILIGNHTVECLDFDKEQSFMVSYGIDKQTNPKFSKKTLSSVTVLDAHQVCMALIDKGVLKKDNVRLFAASKDLDMCTVQGMKESFQTAARQVGDKGLLIFHFSGHGISVVNEWGLAPADFDYTRDTFIGGEVLNSWLNEVHCKAQYVIISLDCCYAGGIANELTATVPNLRSGTYVISACTAFETSLVIGPLEHSVFAYFLSYAIRVTPFSAGSLPIHKIFKECSTLCRSLTAFLVSYSPSFGLKINAMQPELKYFDVSALGSRNSPNVLTPISETNPLESMMSFSRYSFVTKYFSKLNITATGELCSLCLDWLGSMTENGRELQVLAKRGLLRDEVLNAVICLMMWSFASIQFVEDIDNVNKASHFLLAFLYTSYALDSSYDARLTLEHMEQSLEFYLGVVEENKVDCAELLRLKDEINRDISGAETHGAGKDGVLSRNLEVDALESMKVS